MADSEQSRHLLSIQRLWSPDIHRDIEWQKLENNQRRRFRHHRSKSIDDATGIDVTDDNVKELKACFDLGFDFGVDDLDLKLSHAFPALELYAAVNQQYNSRILSRSSSIISESSSSQSTAIVDPTRHFRLTSKVKTKLKLWAQLVSCSLLAASSQLANNKHAEE
ncbi:hypothetical protein SSX86_024026 [Deinandra increscens subsp. villosa]|uniref:Uncharacterized protein n=1 Tax=Deinandra increscens subsp. villosa TaxID=3103831 RepID=A0AAP0CNU1_9ASTR